MGCVCCILNTNNWNTAIVIYNKFVTVEQIYDEVTRRRLCLHVPQENKWNMMMMVWSSQIVFRDVVPIVQLIIDLKTYFGMRAIQTHTKYITQHSMCG